MPLFGRKSDPIDSLRHKLDAEIEALEKREKALRQGRAKPEPAPQPRIEPVHPAPPPHISAELPPLKSGLIGAPEPPEVGRGAIGPTHSYNENGVRKLDLPALLKRFTRPINGPSPQNKRIVHMIATGSLHGPRPLRIERKIARRRSIALFILLLVVLFGLVRVFVRDGR
ncbi:MAG TPA: hypothetical protein VMF06_02305 [Candidatus Limnocylindria bacterium]|jgi:hypothetical protein|nr:hypothetical protein [Candidatus Limnocylindria bacterium]